MTFLIYRQRGELRKFHRVGFYMMKVVSLASIIIFTFLFRAVSQSNTLPLPSGRSQMAATFDTDKNLLFVFGGDKHPNDTASSIKLDNNLWCWNDNVWKALAPAGPSWREDAKMIYHSKEKKIYLFGGRSYDITHQPIIFDETWVWDGRMWTQLKPKHTPGKTLHANMVYDPVRNRIVMFGGVKTDKKDGPPFVNEVWEWDGSEWELMAAQNAPTPRIAHSMTYSTALKKTLIIGGVTLEGTTLQEVWSWDGKKFALLDSNLPKIELGPGNAVCIDTPDAVNLLVFGRLNSLANLQTENSLEQNGSSWVWDGKNWNQVSTPLAPFLRENHVMYLDASHQRAILFGGSARAERHYKSFNDVWFFSKGNWSNASPGN